MSFVENTRITDSRCSRAQAANNRPCRVSRAHFISRTGGSQSATLRQAALFRGGRLIRKNKAKHVKVRKTIKNKEKIVQNNNLPGIRKTSNKNKKNKKNRQAPEYSACRITSSICSRAQAANSGLRAANRGLRRVS